MSQTNASIGVRNILLVHGGFVDGSGWEGVYKVLKNDGYTVTIVQNPTISLADDVAVTKRAIAAQNGPVVLVGHSYVGAVISQAGNDPNVAGLVYITAFAPDKGESVSSLIQNPPSGAPVPPILPLKMDISFLIEQNFLQRLLEMFQQTPPRSWAIPKSHGVWKRCAARSLSRPGDHCQAGSWYRQRTR